MLYTGLRSEEIMGLRWGDINQKEKTITVRRVVTRVAKGEFLPVERSKNDKVRILPMGTNSLCGSNLRSKRAYTLCQPFEVVDI